MKKLVLLIAVVLFLGACEKQELQNEQICSKVEQWKSNGSERKVLNTYKLYDHDITTYRKDSTWQTKIVLTGDSIKCEFKISSLTYITDYNGDYYEGHEYNLLSNKIFIDNKEITDKYGVVGVSIYNNKHYITFDILHDMTYYSGYYEYD